MIILLMIIYIFPSKIGNTQKVENVLKISKTVPKISISLNKKPNQLKIAAWKALHSKATAILFVFFRPLQSLFLLFLHHLINKFETPPILSILNHNTHFRFHKIFLPH